MKTGFIGFGHMAGAMAKGFIKSGFLRADEIYACASDLDRLSERISRDDILSNSAYGKVNALSSPLEVVESSDIIIVAVKPNQVETVLSETAGSLDGKIIISVAFGWDFARYEELLPGTKHISIIPNTPCEVLMGMTIMEEKHNLSPDELESVEALLTSFGEIEYFSSEKMWLAGELTSCGPAFAAMFIEALGDAGAKYGIDQEKAYRIVSQMVAGTGTLQIETGKLPGKMAEEVATPGGITIKGVTALREADFHEVVEKAIDAIENR